MNENERAVLLSFYCAPPPCANTGKTSTCHTEGGKEEKKGGGTNDNLLTILVQLLKLYFFDLICLLVPM
jgi:hypothetical protein